MTHKEPPRPAFIFPDVREAAFYQLTGHKTGAGRIIDWLHSFEAHYDDERSISPDEFNFTIES